MLKKINQLLFAGASLLALNANAQDCVTDQVSQQMKAEHPVEIAAAEAALESRYQTATALQRLAKTTDDTTLYHIPTVVHVIHEYGSEFVTDDAIFTAVKNWNIMFQKMNADTADVIAPFKQYIGNARIQLDLATKDPNGNPTKGITRRFSYLSYAAGQEAKMDYWAQDKYLNIWLIGSFDGSHAGAAAYSQYPGTIIYSLPYDGVISLYNYVDYDNTIVHEVGHYLNLQHTWGNTNAPAVACGDDQVDDTPPTKGHNTTGCIASNLYDTDCAGNYYKTYTINNQQVVVDYPDTVNAQNVMDYTYCSKMFTKLQVERMRSALTSSTASRSNLITASNLATTGANVAMQDLSPVAEFSVERGYLGNFPASERMFFTGLGSGMSFAFRNFSWNDTITSVAWTFSNNASTPTSTNATSVVKNTFATPGWVSVSLTANGNNTTPTTYTNEKAVYVADSVMLQPGGYYQNFSSDNEMNNWPYFNVYNNTYKWERYSGAGVDDNSCMRYRSFDYRSYPENRSGSPVGDYDDMFTPGFTLSGYTTSNLNLNFYTSGAATASSTGDTLEIAASTNLGRSWTTFQVLTSSALSNVGTTSSEFVPTSSAQWRAQTISIPAAYKTDKVFFRFRYKPSETGNNMYMDKFSITQFTTEVNELVQNAASFKLYPNPTNGDAKMFITTGNDGNVSYQVKDITGKTIYANTVKYAANSFGEETLPASIFPTTGMYLITVKMADKIITEKLMVGK